MSSSLLQFINPVPFFVDTEANLGLTQAQGLLSCDGDNLVFEWILKDALMGARIVPMRTVTVPMASIRSLRLRRRFFGLMTRLEIRAVDQAALEDLPESKQGVLVVAVKRRDRDVAEDFCLEIGQALARMRADLIASTFEEPKGLDL